MAYTATKFWRGIADYVKVDTVDMGGTGTNVEFSFDVETEDMICGQSRTAISTIETSKKYQVKFQFAEYSFENIALALGQAAANLTDDTYLLITSAEADEVALEIKVKNEAEDFYHIYYFPKCKVTESGGVPYEFRGQGFIDITFDCLAHVGANIGYVEKIAV